MKKICVIMIGFHSEYARMTTEGMTDQAAVLGYQIYVHSYFGLRFPTEKTFAGETNILKAKPHNYCRADAKSDFLSDCIKSSQAYWRMSRDFCVI